MICLNPLIRFRFRFVDGSLPDGIHLVFFLFFFLARRRRNFLLAVEP